MSLVSGQELESKFCLTRTYGKDPKRWPRSTICLLKCEVKDCDGEQTTITGSDEYDDWERFDNTKNKRKYEKRKHAEIHMLDYLYEKDIKQYKEIEIYIFVNYSPCINCARKIFEFKQHCTEWNSSVRIGITFANFYRCHGRNKDNRDGLVKLLQADVDLYVFDYTTWGDFLYGCLKLSETRKIEHVIRDVRKRNERAVRETIDMICLECLKKKSKSSLEETDKEERHLDQVFAIDDESVLEGMDYEKFVIRRRDEYLEHIDEVTRRLNNVRL